ncbi:hypothetical protein F3Y22_tig00111151pilonHSYRG00136 [Hibiscus syriacus]|uniref:Uncharacterized protein n=1 Tax=Hibiscus syriacus TaxID=106335 RepID=A0A6A2YXU7_HIBSY|nr:hypothetical protein F3Y22_tig00111151pilonHSYRG00136 [Hibiscus syriacus]
MSHPEFEPGLGAAIILFPIKYIGERKMDISTQPRKKMGKQVVEQLDAQMILAMKGHLKETRNPVAYELAKHLQYPLINQDVITPSPKNSQDLNDISFGIALKIASIQLKVLKLGVIVSTPLGQRSHLDKLKEQANSDGAILVIIQCLPTDKRLLKEFQGSPLTPESQPLMPKNLFQMSWISRCQKSTSGPHYQCFLGCDEYIFDKACAELPSDIEIVGKNCPVYLRRSQPEYLFPKDKRRKCKICEDKDKEFSDSCHDCLLQTNMKGAFLPIIVNHESHAHPLNLLMMPLSYY